MRGYHSVHFGLRSLCTGCAERNDAAAARAVEMIGVGALFGSLIFGLILMVAGALGVGLIVTLIAGSIIGVSKYRRAHEKALRQKSYYKHPDPHAPYTPTPEQRALIAAAPKSAEEIKFRGGSFPGTPKNTPQPLPPVDKTSPHYYKSPDPYATYIEKPEETPCGREHPSTPPPSGQN
jgi:predicted lipid-binding transport protein (Tim44 family)